MAETRVTSGAFRGRLIDTPKGRAIRPTTSLVRKALFDILGDVEGIRFVDLFAGSGALSFEALSRGAARAVAVERDRDLVAMIRGTAERLGCADRLRAVGADVHAWLRSRPVDLTDADVVVLDAPYRDDVVLAVLAELGDAPPALVVCEHHRSRALPESPGSLRRSRQAIYGTTQLTFYHRRRDDEVLQAPPVGEPGSR